MAGAAYPLKIGVKIARRRPSASTAIAVSASIGSRIPTRDPRTDPQSGKAGGRPAGTSRRARPRSISGPRRPRPPNRAPHHPGRSAAQRLDRRDRVVERTTAPPASPGDPIGQVERRGRPALPRQAQVVGGRRPEPGRVGGRPAPGAASRPSRRPSRRAGRRERSAQGGSPRGPSARVATVPRCRVARRPGRSPAKRTRGPRRRPGVGSRDGARMALGHVPKGDLDGAGR